MTVLRKIAAITFLAIFTIVVFNYILFNVFVGLKKSEFRKQVLLSVLSTGDSERILIPTEELYVDGNGLEWHEHGKEVSIAGKFYEVLSVKKTNDVAEVIIIKDENENRLFGSFFKTGAKSSGFLQFVLKIAFGLDCANLFQHKFSVPYINQTSLFNFNAQIPRLNCVSGILRPPIL